MTVNQRMPTTIEDISRRLGLSISTVSKALNDYPDVAAETRTRVLAMARELDYFPSSTARNLRRRRTGRIGLLINYPITAVGEYVSRLLIGAALAAERYGKNLVVYPLHEQQARQIQRICRGREVDGLLMLWGTRMDESSAYLSNQAMPFVLVARRSTREDVRFVVADNRDGAYRLTRHLIQLGHRRIAFTPMPELRETNLDRFAGYVAALEEAGLPCSEELVATVPHIAASRASIIGRLLDLDEPPTAIFAFNDIVAMETLQVAAERGLRVPDDLAIAGFDGVMTSLMATPPLTTVAQPIEKIGERAVELLEEEVEGESDRRRIMPVELIVRESTVGAAREDAATAESPTERG